MTSHYRNQIKISCEEADTLLNAQKTFAVPARLPTQTNTVYSLLLKSLIQTLEDETQDTESILNEITSASDRWMSLRTNMTGNERIADTPIYEKFSDDVPFQQRMADLRKYTRDLRDQKRKLEAALPPVPPIIAQNPNPANPPSTPSFVHLPKTTLPTFSGSCAEYISFWNTFKAGVDDLPSLSNAIKFTYLKQCLTGPPLTLVNSLPVTDASYTTALDLLKTNYGKEEDVTRSLHQSLRKLPRVRSGDAFCADLRSLVDQVESICVQMSQQSQTYNTIAVQMEIEERLPRFALTEIFKAKEDNPGDWSTDLLKQRLRTILKRQEHIESLSSKDTSGTSSSSKKVSNSPNPPLQQNPFVPNSTLTFHTQNTNQQSRPQSSKSKPTPRLPCLFCTQEGHFSSSCKAYPDVKTRTECLRTQKRCFKCLKTDHFANKCPSPSNCSQCAGHHPRPLCPNKRGQSVNKQPQTTHYTQNQTPPLPVQPPFSPTPTPYSHTPMPTFHPSFYPQFYQTQAVPSLASTIIPSSPQTPTPGPHPSNQPSNQTNASTTNNTISIGTHPLLLKCVKVQFFNPNDKSKFREGILLLDDASTSSYIATAEAKMLKLHLTPNSVQLGVFNNPKSYTVPSFTTTFGIRLVDGRSLIVHADAVDHLTQPTSHIPFNPEFLLHTDLLPYCKSESPIILLGSDYYYDVEPTPIMKLPSGYRLIQTLLGPIIAGKAFSPLAPPPIQIINVSIQEPPLVPPQDFFTLESIGITDMNDDSTSDDLIMQKFNSDIEFVSNRYQVKFPWKSTPASLPLPTNYGLCWGRLRSVLNTLSKTPSLLAKYDAIIQDQFRLGIVEPVDSEIPCAIPPPLHYLPHHPVINEIKNKVRIVYDGSAQTGKALSINECLHPGPVILPDLVGLLLRFRFPKIAIASDIEKAFLQVSVHPCDRNSTRFLWVKNPLLPLSQSNLQIYRFARVPFGLSPSPFLLAATIKYHLSQHPSLLSTEISNNIYVDNILLFANSPEEGREKCRNSISLFNKAGMRLREFISNSPLALNQLTKEETLPGNLQKFLGITWNTVSDNLVFHFVPPPSTFIPSKRTILAFIASHFDPMGLFSPILLPLKSYLQHLWLHKLDWDEPLSTPLTEEWHKMMEGWNTEEITVPRHLPSFPTPLGTLQLHCFADASSFAMCAAVYIRVSHPSSPAAVSSLVFSKTKIKPVDNKKTHLTIPRLELLAALIGTRAIKFVQKQLSELPIEPTLNLWSDSSAVIAWLNCQTPLREIFVQNRVTSIRSTPNLIVRHIPGTHNPADIGTRGLPSTSALNNDNNSLWWCGPTWLNFAPESWPSPTQDTKPFSSLDFRHSSPKPIPPIFTCQSSQHPIPVPLIDPKRFSRLPKMLRSIAYLNRFISRMKTKIIPHPHLIPFPTLSISTNEIRSALQFIVKQEQTLFPPPDRDNEGLGLFLGPNKILRSKGRLGKSRLPRDTIEPIYLPPQSALTRLIIYETHLLNHHTSPLLTLSLIRRQFWIPKGRKTVEHTISKCCLPCRRFTASSFDLPPFPHLPTDRVRPSPPFSAIGLDFCGPLYIKARSPHRIKHKNAVKPPTEKIWIVLWVCLATRGLSLDLVLDQSSHSFILAYRRFCAKYGSPSTIYCDNAPTFVSFSKSNLPNPQPNWNFRPPSAAWKGGHYERTVALIKFHLRRSISPGIFPYILPLDQIATILAEIETIINTRPITFDSSNPLDPRPLRPIDFIRPIGHNYGLKVPSLDEDTSDNEYLPESNTASLTLLWNHISSTTQKFWSHWSQEYLLSLRERHKKLAKSSGQWPTPGELVLVCSENLPRSLWTIARILEITTNEEHFADTAKIKLSSGHVTIRSVRHLFPLETKDELQPRITTVPPPLSTHPSISGLPISAFPTTSNPENYIQLRNRKVPRQ